MNIKKSTIIKYRRTTRGREPKINPPSVCLLLPYNDKTKVLSHTELLRETKQFDFIVVFHSERFHTNRPLVVSSRWGLRHSVPFGSPGVRAGPSGSFRSRTPHSFHQHFVRRNCSYLPFSPQSGPKLPVSDRLQVCLPKRHPRTSRKHVPTPKGVTTHTPGEDTRKEEANRPEPSSLR